MCVRVPGSARSRAARLPGGYRAVTSTVTPRVVAAVPRAPGRCSGEVLVRTSYVRNTASRKRSLRGVCTHTQGDVAVWRNGSSDGKGRDRSWSAAAGSPRKAPLAQQKGGSRRDSIEQSGGELTSTKGSTTPHNAQSVPNPSAKGRAPRPFEIPRPSVRIQRRPLRLRAWARDNAGRA